MPRHTAIQNEYNLQHTTAMALVGVHIGADHNLFINNSIPFMLIHTHYMMYFNWLLKKLLLPLGSYTKYPRNTTQAF